MPSVIRDALHVYAERSFVKVQRVCSEPDGEGFTRLEEWTFPVPLDSGQLPIEVRTDTEGLIVWAFWAPGVREPLLTVGAWTNEMRVPDWPWSMPNDRGRRPYMVIHTPPGVRVASMAEPGYRRQPMVPTCFSRLIDELIRLQNEHLEGKDGCLTADELQDIGSRMGFNLAHNGLPYAQAQLVKEALGYI
jgi:hypothetical protein